MNLFIDTNILLSFYHLTDEDIEELKKLVSLVKHKKIIIWTTSHLYDEFKRNRDSKIKDALKDYKGPSMGGRAPAFLKDYKEYDHITAILKTAGKKYSELMKRVTEDIAKLSLSADRIIADLLSTAKHIELSEDLFTAALRRKQLGNPPGKSSTVGDELNWESLLSGVPKGEDIHLVSADLDYASSLNKEELSPFLADEWKTIMGSTAYYYPKLSTFFGSHFPDIKLASEIDKKMLIEKLSASSAFYSTHITIGRLSSFGDFTPNEVEDLIAIAMTNTQVGQIIGDADLEKFYATLLEKYGEDIDPRARAALQALLYP